MENAANPTPTSPSTGQASNGASNSSLGAQRPAGGETLARAAQGAHQAVDATVAKVAPVIDGVQERVDAAKGAAATAKDALANAKDSADEWLSAARDTVRAHPLAAIAGALLVGAAYNSLTSRKR